MNPETTYIANKMETTIKANGKTVTITLTSEQVAQIRKETTHYTDIKTVEDAFEFLGLDYKKWLQAREDQEADVLAYEKLRVIVKALNGGRVMDYNNTDENKYYPLFNSFGSSAGFSYGDYFCAFSRSVVCSRLCLIDSDRATYAGKQFIEVYNQFINA